MQPHLSRYERAAMTGGAATQPSARDPSPIARIRPLSLADCPAFRAFAARLLPEDLRRRFGGPVRLDGGLCARFLDVDRNREEAFAAFDRGGAIVGVARMVRVAAAEAEIALIVRSDLKRRGIGRALIGRLIRQGLALGLAALRGDVLRENHAMLRLARATGFRFGGAGGLMVEVRLELAPARLAGPAPSRAA
jgi:acetyltransferase